MTYGALLILHLLGAGATGAVSFYSVFSIARDRESQFRLCAMVLGALACIEILTGTLLSLISHDIGAASVCARVGMYLAFVSVVEIILFIKIKRTTRVFPLRAAVVPSLASLPLLLAAVVLGF